MALAVGQRLVICGHVGRLAETRRPSRRAAPASRGVDDPVDIEPALDHLHLVAGQADDALDEILVRLAGRSEHRRCRRAWAANRTAGRASRWARDRGSPAANSANSRRNISTDEQIVADQQRRDQRARGDVERLEQHGAHDQRDQQRLNDDLDGLPPTFFLSRRGRVNRRLVSSTFGLAHGARSSGARGAALRRPIQAARRSAKHACKLACKPGQGISTIDAVVLRPSRSRMHARGVAERRALGNADP